MRIAIVSDIHANLTAFEAVLRDLDETSPDLIMHGGDLADGGANGAAIVDQLRALGWRGVVGNTDEMLAMPEVFEDFARKIPELESVWSAARTMAEVSRDDLGGERLDWLRRLPPRQTVDDAVLVHATPGTRWEAPDAGASEEELDTAYGALGRDIVVYGHIHVPFVWTVGRIVVANSGSVGRSLDGDPRASYLLMDGSTATIRRVEYDLDREIAALMRRRFPHAEWVARIMKNARPEVP